MERDKHILLFISALRKGGAERVMVNLADCLHRQGIRVTLVTQYLCENEYELPAGIPRLFSEITGEEAAGSRIGDFLARYRKLRRIIREQNPDCVLSFIGKNNLMAVAACLFTRIPVVVSVRGEPGSEYGSVPMRFLARTLFGLAAGVIVQTRSVLNFFPAWIRKKAVILKNPLNPAFVRPRFEGERDGRILTVGRVDENKNQEMMIRAFARIAGDFPKASMVLYGDGDQRERLMGLVKELGLTGRVSLPGAQTDIADKIYTGSLFLLASGHEGMPNALIEAMCLGLPCISTDCPCGGPAELIRDGENGFLIPVGDEEALAERMRLLLSDPERAEQMGRQAARLLEEYRPEKVNADWTGYLLSKCRKR